LKNKLIVYKNQAILNYAIKGAMGKLFDEYNVAKLMQAAQE